MYIEDFVISFSHYSTSQRKVTVQYFMKTKRFCRKMVFGKIERVMPQAIFYNRFRKMEWSYICFFFLRTSDVRAYMRMLNIKRTPSSGYRSEIPELFNMASFMPLNM